MDLLLEEAAWFDGIARALAVHAEVSGLPPGLADLLREVADYVAVPTLPDGRRKVSRVAAGRLASGRVLSVAELLAPESGGDGPFRVPAVVPA